MRKQFFLYSALFWSGLILYLCLKNADEITKIDIPYIDKLIHIVFHFVFTTLWFLYLKKKFTGLNKSHLLWYSVAFSFVFGIAVELLQEFLTTTRSADFFDVMANLSGTLLATLLIVLINAYNGSIDKI